MLYTDGRQLLRNGDRKFTACQKGRAPRLFSIGAEDGQKANSVRGNRGFREQSVVKATGVAPQSSKDSRLSARSCRRSALTHSSLYIGRLHLFRVTDIQQWLMEQKVRVQRGWKKRLKDGWHNGKPGDREEEQRRRARNDD